MRWKKAIRKLTLSLLSVFVVVGAFDLPTQAGHSVVVIGKNTYEEDFNTSIWNNADSDVYVEEGTIIIPDNSTDLTRLITKTIAKKTNAGDNVAKMDATLQFTALPETQKFAVGFGLGSVESLMGDEGNVEVVFINNGGLKVSVVAYGEDGETVVMEEKSCGAIGRSLQMQIAVSEEQKLSLSINGQSLCNVKIPVSGEGRIGFLQTGSCGAKISNLLIETYRYDTPENVDVFEDFEDGSIDGNILTSKMIRGDAYFWPTGAEIEEKDGNHVFSFKNAQLGYLGTKYQYSNFELSFDVPYVQNTTEIDDEGNIIVNKNNCICVAFGSEAMEHTWFGYEESVDMVIFTENNVRSMNTENSAELAGQGFPILSEDCDKPFSIKVAMKDSVITVSLKWLDEDTFTDVFSYQISKETPTGYLQIWTNGETANYALDNLKIVNTDNNAVYASVKPKSAKVSDPGDFKYEQTERVYKIEEKEDLSIYLVIPVVAVLCIVVFVSALGIMKIKNKSKRKDGVASEE